MFLASNDSSSMLMIVLGSPGWNAFVQPLLQNINPSLRSQESADAVMTDTTTAEFVDLTADRVLVQSKLLEQSLKRLKILILSNPSPGLCRRVLRPVLLQIWALASWGNPSKGSEEAFKNPARALMQTFLRLFGNVDTIMPLVENICCKGSLPSVTERWKYHLSPTGIIDIVVPRSLSDADVDLNEIDAKSIEMVNLISDTCSAEETSSIFLHLLRRWIQTAESQSDSTSNIRLSPEALQLNTPVQELVEVTILQKLLDQAPEKLVSHFDQLLDLICGVFKVDERKRLDDDMIGVVLSLLNLVITAPNFQKSDIKSDELEVVEASLSRLSLEDRSDVSSTARNLSMLLRFRDQLEAGEHSGSAPNGGLVEDRRTYNLAMSYITGGGDNPPPVVSEGLNLLSTLVLKESPILDIPALTVLMSNLLKDNEDFINLRVIRIFTQLANKHPKSTTRELIDHYLDAQEKSSTDVRLRFGEALLQVIERLGDTFAEDIAQQVSETLLSIAGRRGYRPKMMGQQAREEKLRQMKQEKAGDNVDDENLSEDDVLGEKERADNDIISQIVKGWDSKRGSEDIRMRASALSILGSAIETNIGGVGPELASASVDLCINILTLEPELEKSILRRAAILLILSFVKALDKAREVRRSLGFGLTDQSREDIMRTLQYVASTDNDGLVQQHARDVVDSLESWQIASIIPQQNEASTSGLTRLAGLKVNPEANSANEADRSRPKIEEVE